MTEDTVREKSKILANLSKLGQVKGFKDFTGQEAKKRAKIRKILVEAFELYGFEPAETPIVEYEEFVKGENASDEAVSDIFKLEDRGKRKLALRYEFTFQLKRLMKNQKQPYKRYQIGVVFRDEPVTGNRFRQFTQCDVDVVGSDVRAEAEVLAVVKNVLDKLGVEFVISINNRQLLDEILKAEKIKDKVGVIRELDKLDKLSEGEVKKNLEKFGAENLVDLFKKPESYFKKYDSYFEIDELKKACAKYGIKVKFAPSLARGLSYYNGSIFEVKTKEMKESILGGGSFKFNNVQSTGISFGLDRLAGVAKIEDEKKSVLVVSIGQDDEAIELAEKLRAEGVRCSVLYGKVTKALEFANSKGIDWVILIGEKEINEKKFTLKNMESGKESKLGVDGVIRKLR